MADQRITQLQPLTETEVAASDVLPIVDISASENKKVTVKDLFEAGAALADNSSIDITKINQSSATKLSSTALADGSVTAAKLANDSSIVYDSVEPTLNNFEGRGYVNSTSKNLKVYDGAAYQQIIAPTAGIEDAAVTNAKIADNAVNTSKIDSGGLANAAYADLSVTGSKLANSTITSGKFAVGAVDSNAIADSAVITSKIADSGVTTEKLNAGAVTGTKLGASSATVIAANNPAGNGEFNGQQWFNTSSRLAWAWNGTEWQQQAGIQSIAFSDTTPLAFTSSVDSSGAATITSSMEAQAAGQVLAGPVSGASATPTFRAIASGDLPVATGGAAGASKPGTGLTVDGTGTFNHSNVAVSGTYTKVTIDSQGHVATGATLEPADIPDIPAEKLTSGTLSTNVLGSNSIGGIKLADSSTVQFGGAGSTSNVVTFPTAQFKGQQFYDEINGDLYLWSGSAWLPITVTAGELIFAGTYDASTNKIVTLTSAGAALLGSTTVPVNLPTATSGNNRYYFVVAVNGTGTSPAPIVALQAPDIIVSNGSAWTLLDVSATVAGVSTPAASAVTFTPYGNIASANVQAAIQELEDEKLSKTGGVITGALEIGSSGSLVFEGVTADANETTLTAANPTADNTIVLPNQSGTVLLANNASIVNADINASAGIVDTKLGTILTTNKVSLSALNISGASAGTTYFSDPDSLPFYDVGTATNYKVTASELKSFVYASVSGDITINSSGVAAIASGSIVNADISGTAEIAVSKLQDGQARQLLQTDSFGTGVEWTSNVDIPGTLDVTGAVVFDSTLVVNGAITAASNITLNGQSDLRWADSDNSNWVAFQAPSTITTDTTWTLPAADGSARQALITDGAGTLSFAHAAGALYYRLNSDRALANLNTAQDIFGVGVALAASTVYEFEGAYILVRPSGSYSSHGAGIGFAEIGGLTVNNISYLTTGVFTTSNSIIAPDVLQHVSSTANTSVAAAVGATTSALYLRLMIKGTISTNAAGSFKPQITFTAAPGASQVYSVKLGSYFKIWPIGAAGSDSSAGTWA